MKRKKIKATKKNKELIKTYREEISYEHFFGLTVIKVVCSKCQASFRIRTHNPELYTEELVKNYVCLNCKPIRRNNGSLY